MGFATHLGPWLLGTVKNTTGTTAGTVRNTGATTVAQPIPLTYSAINASLTGTIGALPAGALITSIQYITSTVFSGATTLSISIGGQAVAAAASTITTVGTVTPTIQSSFVPTQVNVGSTDALITYTATGSGLTTGAVTVLIQYVVRDSSGNYAQPASQQ